MTHFFLQRMKTRKNKHTHWLDKDLQRNFQKNKQWLCITNSSVEVNRFMNSTEKDGLVINGAKKRFASHEHYHAFLKDQQYTTSDS